MILKDREKDRNTNKLTEGQKEMLKKIRFALSFSSVYGARNPKKLYAFTRMARQVEVTAIATELNAALSLTTTEKSVLLTISNTS